METDDKLQSALYSPANENQGFILQVLIEEQCVD